jgi:hypothetical protein
VVVSGIAAVQPGGGDTRGIPNQLGIEGLNEVLRQFSTAFEVGIPASWLALGAAASATSLMVRFLRSRGEERQQIKWVAYAMVLQISLAIVDVFFLRSILLNAVGDRALCRRPRELVDRRRRLEVPPLRDRPLHQPQPRLRRSHDVPGVLVYLGSIVLLQALFRALTGQGSQLAIIASTLAIAALFNPLRRRV